MKNKVIILSLFLGWPVMSWVCHAQTTLRINEFMASNKYTVWDEDDDASDWIELYNPTDAPISLSGWSLTNSASKPRKWKFPAMEVGAHAYLLVFASDKNRKDPAASLHTNFKLGAEGDYLALVDAEGNFQSELNPYPPQTRDASYGLCDTPDGSSFWCYYDDPTPRLNNAETALNARLPRPEFGCARGFYESRFRLELISPTPGCRLYYSLDGSVPSDSTGILYTGPIDISTTRIVRAVACDAQQRNLANSNPNTATYLFVTDVMKQPNNPVGYPEMWGPYSGIKGTAIADYEMDPELMADNRLAAETMKGLKSLPVISLVTDRLHLFCDSIDPEVGGIYIYTGGSASSTGGGVGYGWKRPTSMEIFSADNQEEAQVDCALKVHGNASRQPEKSPKHSFRVQFKSGYGPTKFSFPLFGEEEVDEFNQLVLRAGFGNTWCHWTTGEQNRAMFTRDPWSKAMLKAMGWPTPNTTFAHLFLNGMYWGVYNPIERIDGDFCESHLGGEAANYDVVRISDGEGLEAQEGNLEAYNQLFALAENAQDYATFMQMQGKTPDGELDAAYPVLLDVDNFIDYMLVNQYGANTDWDHHNWAAARDRTGSQGFYFMCWDAEHVLKGVYDNVLDKNNAYCPSSLFQKLMQNAQFKQQYMDRVQKHCMEADGLLSPQGAHAVWKKLNDLVEQAIYAESARWGDYRRDVHPYASRGSLYLKEKHFDSQKKYMEETYFPQRTQTFIGQLMEAGYYVEGLPLPKLYINSQIAERTDTVYAEDNLNLTGTGRIYYTLDGQDPLIWQNGSSKINYESAKRYAGTFHVAESCTLLARVYSNRQWSPLLEQQLVYAGTNDMQSLPSDPILSFNAHCSGNNLEVTCVLAAPGQLQLEIYDTAGRLMEPSVSESVERKYETFSLPVTRLASGIYVARLTFTGGGMKTMKTIKFIK